MRVWRDSWKGVFILSLVFVSWQLLTPTPVAIIGPYDKLIHFVAFGFLALGLDMGWPTRRLSLESSFWSDAISKTKIIGLAAYGGLTELIQHWVPGRSMSFVDWLADISGILVYGFGMALLLVLIRKITT